MWLSAGLMALILVVMLSATIPGCCAATAGRSWCSTAAFTDHVALVAHLEQMLGARVHAAIVQRLDLVNDTTIVDVRYSRRSGAAPPRPGRLTAGAAR